MEKNYELLNYGMASASCWLAVVCSNLFECARHFSLHSGPSRAKKSFVTTGNSANGGKT